MRHPIVKGIIAVVVFIVVAEFLVTMIPPAWAQVSIPITDHITISLGELPQWIIALVAAGGLWKAYKAEQHANRAADAATTAATASAAAVLGIAVIQKQTDGVLEKVAALAKTAGKDEGHKEAVAEVAQAKAIARTDAIADAEVAAKVKAAENETPKA